MVYIHCAGCNVDNQHGVRFHHLAQITCLSNPLEFLNRQRISHQNKNRHLEILLQVPANAQICHNCYNSAQRLNEHNQNRLTSIRKGHNTHSGCVFGCHIPPNSNCVTVPKIIRRELLMKHSFYAAPHSRMCSRHLSETDWALLANQIDHFVEPEFLPTIVTTMQEFYLERENESMNLLNMDQIEQFDDQKCRKWFAVDKNQFLTICKESSCDAWQAGVLLCKMRTALSNELIGTLFGMSKSSIANYLEKAIDFLNGSICKNYVNNFSRSDLLKHNSEFASKLFDMEPNNLCLLIDTTYEYIEKSANNPAQRDHFSPHKLLPLYKLMIGVSPDGFIPFVFGPYKAKDNDATILKDSFTRFSDNLKILQKNDILIADRGYRDSVEFVKSKNLKIFLPSLKTGNEQLTTEEANNSKFVTKLRWQVEAASGVLKKRFKLLAIESPNRAIKHSPAYFFIAAALHNRFHSPVISDKEFPGLANRMRSLLHKPNNLELFVEKFHMNRIHKDFVQFPTTSQLISSSFPSLSLTDLHLLSCGSYQLSNCASYYSEHIANHKGVFYAETYMPIETKKLDLKECGIEVLEPVFVRVPIHSKYHNRIQNLVYILADKQKKGIDSIVEHFCSCKSGSKTCGCCSHTMVVLWYLSYAHAHPELLKIINPAMSSLSFNITK